jgi:DnaJ family protein C protein 9
LTAAKESDLAEKIAKKKSAKKDGGLDSLAALIQSRQASRGNFFDALEAKYASAPGNGKKGKGKKRANEEVEEEPSEEAFQAAAARLKNKKPGNDRRAKRMKE